ncbi:MAG: histidine phosphatase family protein [Euryarchaeota archaeon]|nr:histidine phosphatase family protein [Euryarchaeota archaeon]MCG2737388.1 histidine phosphatase family protein [Candidatus Methanoperedenaceae archaeon]
MHSLFLVRHAECYKNIRDEHGGKGDILTEKGKKQLSSLSKNIKHIIALQRISITVLFYSNTIQAVQTAEYLSKKLKVPLRVDERIAPLNLGLLAGLSSEEATTKFPEAESRIEKWRAGKLEIRDLCLPDAENFDIFWNRGQSFITELTKERTSAIVVGSRSTLILLMNMLLYRNPYVNGEYHPWNFACASFACFSYANEWNLTYAKDVQTVDGKAPNASGEDKN